MDVLYAKGQPSDVLEEDTGGVFPFPGSRISTKFSDIPQHKTALDYKYWSYDSTETGRIDIDFSPRSKRVTRIFCYAGSVERTLYPCPKLLGITGGEEEEQVLKQLGVPSQVEMANDLSAVKTLYYSQWNVAFLLERRRVYGLQVESDKDLTALKTTASSIPAENKPPAECASASNADECADILKKSGRNPN